MHDVDAAAFLAVADEVVTDSQAAQSRMQVFSRAAHPRSVRHTLAPLAQRVDPALCRSRRSVLDDVFFDLAEVGLSGAREVIAPHLLRPVFASSRISRRSWSKNSSPSTTSPWRDCSTPMAMRCLSA